MDFITIALIGGILLFLILAIALAVPLILRRRASSTEDAEEGRPKAKKAARKKPAAKRAAKKPGKIKGKSAQAASQAETAPPPPAEQSNVYQRAPGEKIRILIVDDNEGTRDNVSRLLYFENDMEVVGQAMTGIHGVDMAIELKPHIVLMDINMPDMDGITATHEMGMKCPFSQVIIMSVQNDQHYMRRAMTAGARDFQPKPFTSEELVNCIRRVYKIGGPFYQRFEEAERAKAQQADEASAQAKELRMRAPIIVVYGPKGGVGTSAIASNLAVSLQQQVRETVLMDADLQFGDIPVHLNAKATRTMIDLVHESGLEIDLVADVLLPHQSGLKLLLGPPKPELADVVTEAMVTDIITELRNQFKAVVIDTDGNLSNYTLAVLDKADYILVVTIPELPAIKDAKLFLELAEQLNFAPDRIKVVINRANELGGIPAAKVQEVLQLDHAFLIPQDPRLDASIRRGTPICQQDTSAPAAIALTDMARQVWDYLSEPEAAAEEVA